MSRVNKILISLSFAFIVAFSFMFANLQPLFAKADSISNYNVNFVAPDNSLLYSTGNYVPSGSSLQDIENNNLVLNSDFLSNSDGQSSYTNTTSSNKMTVDNWQIVLGANGINFCTVSTLNQGVNVAFTIPTGSSYASGGTPFVQILSSDLVNSLVGQTVTFSLYCKINSGSARFRVSNYSTFGTGNLVDGLNTVTYTVPSGSTQMFCGIITNANTSFDIDVYYAKLEIGSTFTGYFSSNMINSRLSAYNFSNYYYQYDINTTSAITSDKYYYPVKFNYINFIWTPKTWNGFYNINGANVWTDGTYYYYSEDSYQYVLDISTFTWSQKIWNGLTNFNGANVWTDGTYYYYSSGNVQYVLDISTYTWTPKTWNGLTNFTGSYVWTDGNYVYYSLGSTQKVLSGSTWSDKTWNGLTNFSGSYVWTDGVNFYYSSSLTQKVLSGSTWSDKTWNGLGISGFSGYNVWSDGVNFYSSNGTLHYLIDLSSSSLTRITWSGPASFYGDAIFVVDNVCYYSFYGYQYTFTYLSASDIGYNTGFNDGYNTAYNTAYNKGYNLGVENAGNYTFFSLISAVIDAPLKTITGLFNFELLGVNLLNLFTGLLTLVVLLFVIKLALGGK